jgi:drug/metabolite transporter (DMT)-like permease
MALLFLLIFLERPRHLTIIAMSGIAIGVAGVLVVSHSRTAYVAAFLSALTAVLAWAAHRRYPGTVRTPALSALLLSLMVGAIVVTAVSGGFMAERLRQVDPTLPINSGAGAVVSPCATTALPPPFSA